MSDLAFDTEPHAPLRNDPRPSGGAPGDTFADARSAEATAAWLPALLGLSAAELLARAGLDARSDACAYLAGSLAEGMGNSGSDVDVYVVGSAQPNNATVHVYGQARVSVHRLDTRRLAFEYWSDGSVLELAQKLEHLGFAQGGRTNLPLERRLSDEEAFFIHRLRTGRPLLNPERWAAFRCHFDFAKLADYLLRCRLNEIDHWHEDMVGMLDDGHIDAGLLVARELLNVTCEAYGHHLGSTNPRRKWRAQVLAQLPQSAELERMRERYWALWLEPRLDYRANVDTFRAYAHRCIDFCNQVTELMSTR